MASGTRIIPGIMNESDFHRTVDALFERFEGALGDHEALDADLEGGILEVTCQD